VALAAIFAVQALANAEPVVAFPLYLAVVLVVSLQQNRAESITVALVAAIALLVRPASSGQTGELAPAVLLAAVLVAVTVAMNELTRHMRASASAERRRLEGLAASERRLRATLESVEVGLGLAGLDGDWTQVNEPLAAMLGRTRDELMHTTLSAVTAPADRVGLDEALGLLRAGDVARWASEVQQLRPDGTAVPVALFIARLPGSDGEADLLVQATDVSARKRTDALRDCLAAIRQTLVASAGLESAMPQVLDAVRTYLGWTEAQYWTLDTEHGVLSAGGATVVSGEGLVGRVWKSGVLAADASAVAFPVVDSGEVVGVIELESDRPRTPQDDEVTMLAGAGVEIGQFIRRSATAQALRRSEADHRAIYERSPIGIARISSDGELLEANPALLKMLDHDHETMRTSAWPDLLHAYDQAASRSHQASFLAGITDGSSVQVRAATGGGNWLWLQLTATSIPDPNGRLEHVLVLVEDVTTVRETSDRLAESLEAQREANANLEKLDRTKSEFLSIVSHEFRTALTGIQGFSELIRDGGLEADEVRAYGGYIFNDADRVNRLIGDMLDLDRMESGRMTMRTADVDVNEVLTEAIARAAPAAVTVDFKSDLDPRLPIVAGDRDRLIQVVSNLVNNAVKYSPEGGTVTLASRGEGRFALISVTDTGIGIPPDEIAHVFERFRRVRSGAAQSIPGTGLGLTIVKQIVEMHGGKIWVESAVGHGSSFHFTIPLTPEGAGALQLRHA
jgi:PAS domain S-box-containing protein